MDYEAGRMIFSIIMLDTLISTTIFCGPLIVTNFCFEKFIVQDFEAV